jgi:ABC-type amino acid transport substrate-binding protein
VALYGSYAPYLTVESDGSLGGVDGALINGFAKEAGLTVKPYQTTFASTILAVQQKKADMSTYVFYTAARSKQLYYTLPFLSDSVQVFTKSSFTYTGVDSLKGKKVGTVVGYVWAPYLQKVFGSNAKLYPDTASVGQALLNGQIDGYVNGASLALVPPMNTAATTGHPLKAGDWGFPEGVIDTPSYNQVNCGNHGLAEAYDAYVMSQNASGALATIITTAVKAAVGNSTVKIPNLSPDLTVPAQGC